MNGWSVTAPTEKLSVVWARTNIDSEISKDNLEKSRNQWKATELGENQENIWNRVNNKQEKADLEEDTSELV